MKKSFWAATCIFTLFVSTSAYAYFIRPFVRIGPGQVIDGLVVDGATEGSQGFNDAALKARSAVSLDEGTMRLYAEGHGPSAAASAQGVMGDTLTFINGAGTSVDVSFSLEALLNAELFGVTLNNSTLLWNISVAVFETGLVDHTNWFGNALQDDPGDIAPVFFEFLSGDMGNPSADIVDYAVSESIDGSFMLGSDYESYDFFFLASLFGSAATEISSFIWDGENTATAGLSVDQGVTVQSGSGVFFDSGPTDPVPEPATMLLFGTGLMGLLGARSRKKNNS